jgi:hypothetical protein
MDMQQKIERLFARQEEMNEKVKEDEKALYEMREREERPKERHT